MKTKEKAQHTPTPWKVFTNLDNNYSKDIFSKDKRRIVAGLSSDDAEFIVKAVNSHEAMLAALKNIRANIQGLPAIVERGACLVGDKESIESMKVWVEEAISQAEATL